MPIDLLVKAASDGDVDQLKILLSQHLAFIDQWDTYVCDPWSRHSFLFHFSLMTTGTLHSSRLGCQTRKNRSSESAV